MRTTFQTNRFKQHTFAIKLKLFGSWNATLSSIFQISQFLHTTYSQLFLSHLGFFVLVHDFNLLSVLTLCPHWNVQYHSNQTFTDWQQKTAHLFKHSSLVDLFPGNVTHLQQAQGKSFEGWLLNQVRVVNIEAGKHSLSQWVALQPCYLYIHTY